MWFVINVGYFECSPILGRDPPLPAIGPELIRPGGLDRTNISNSLCDIQQDRHAPTTLPADRCTQLLAILLSQRIVIPGVRSGTIAGHILSVDGAPAANLRVAALVAPDSPAAMIVENGNIVR
jgi:hypothetical protein